MTRALALPTTYDFRARIASKKPLYGHTSPETAYVIDDYPSGYKARCRKRVWLEFKPRHGWRLVSQTSQKWTPGEKPEKDAVLRWNRPDASTYALLGACMYMDAQDHVQWEQVGMYDKPEKVLEFVKEFSKADFGAIRVVTTKQLAYIKAKLLGHVAFTVNGVVKPWSDYELGEARRELGAWAEVAKAVDIKVPQDVLDLVDGKIEASKVDPAATQQRMQVERENAEAAMADEVKKTPGAMSYKQFAEYLMSEVKLDDRVLQVKDHWTGTGVLVANFYNLPTEGARLNRGGGAEAENNRQMYFIEGFDRGDADKLVAKVKVELRVNNLGRGSGERAKTNLRAKSGPPAKIAEYLAAHITKMVKEIPPNLTHA